MGSIEPQDIPTSVNKQTKMKQIAAKKFISGPKIRTWKFILKFTLKLIECHVKEGIIFSDSVFICIWFHK